MGSLFRSKDMTLCQLILQSELAYDVLAQLGEAGILHFCDVSEGKNDFQRIFVNEIRACSDMERILATLEEEVKHLNIPPYHIAIDTPPAREYVLLHEILTKVDEDLRIIKENQKDLNKEKTNLQRRSDVLVQTEIFLDKAHVTVPADDGAFEKEPDDAAEPMDPVLGGDDAKQQFVSSSLKLSVICGTIGPKHRTAFERMIWRTCYGNSFFRHSPSNNCFMVIVQGTELKAKVEKVCHAFHAQLFPYITDPKDRNDAINQMKTELADMTSVIEEGDEYQRRIQVDAAKDLAVWRTKVRKIKAIFYTMNLFNLSLSDRCLVGECWCPVEELANARAAILHATDLSSADKPSLLLTIGSRRLPPTYHKTNEFTIAFQEIVNAYGVANYKEVNPAVFTTITFPFLFGVMFGDVGHGIIMTCLALFVVVMRNWIITRNLHRGEMATIVFTGRYIILMMGIFSIYVGLIYNDVFGLSWNIFGSQWNADGTAYLQSFRNGAQFAATMSEEDLEALEVDLDPTQGAFATGSPYPFGIDPVWDLATSNKITFINSFKMKMSIVYGVMQMSFGIVLSCFNHIHRGDYLSIFNEFVPRILFILCLFGYLVIVIFYKWMAFTAAGSACAPSLIIGLINMFMLKYSGNPTNPDGTVCATLLYYPNQQTVQTALLFIALFSVPWMLFAKPVVKYYRQNRKVAQEPLATTEPHGEHEEHGGFFDLFIHECIHTIEYCLGIISNTASYLRLWALSLAHSQLAEVLWTMVLRNGFGLLPGFGNCIAIFIIFAAWAALTFAILIFMEGMSAFLHALRLHWVEFQNKFYGGEGYRYDPFSFKVILEL